jgi:hypothetical protein
MTFPNPLPLVDTTAFVAEHNHDGLNSPLITPNGVPAHAHTINDLPNNISGIPGPRGTLWFVGTTNPGTQSGQLTGDLYINTTTGAIWQLNSGGTWVDTGNKITGPTGAQGPQGIAGITGTADPAQVVVLGSTPQTIDGQKTFNLVPKVGATAVAMPADITAQFAMEAWQNITLQNGFTNYGQGWPNAQYRREFNNRFCRIRGFIKAPGTDTAASVKIFDLASVIKPLNMLMWNAIMSGTSSNVNYVNRLDLYTPDSGATYYMRSAWSVPANFKLDLALFYPLV